MKPFLLLVLLAAPAAAAPRSVWEGVYSSEQAGRGQKAYATECARCHGEDLLGDPDSPPLIKEDFLKKWNGKSVGKLVEQTRKTMPSDTPGRLNRQLSTDIVTYLLSVNGFPAGQGELVYDLSLLNQIGIESKK